MLHKLWKRRSFHYSQVFIQRLACAKHYRSKMNNRSIKPIYRLTLSEHELASAAKETITERALASLVHERSVEAQV